MSRDAAAELAERWTTHLELARPDPEHSDAWASLMLDEATIAGVVTTVLSGSGQLTDEHRKSLAACVADLDAVAGDLAARDYAASLRDVAVAALDLRP